jgi:hypothetical protein
MAVVDAAIAIGVGVGLEGTAAAIAGGAIIGAGVGAGYSLLTGDGNILNSALTGAAIGGAGMGIGAAAGLGGAAATSTEVATVTPALSATSAPVMSGQAALGSVGSASVPASGDAAITALESGASGSVAPATVAPASASNMVNTQMPDFMSGSSSFGGSGGASMSPTGGYDVGSTLGKDVASSGLTTNQMLGYGLAGSAALALLGGQKKNKLSSTSIPGQNPAMIRPYAYSQTKNPNYGQPGQPYFIQSYTAQTPYNAAQGGVIKMAEGGLPAIQTNMYPQSQQEHVQFATPTQMPTSAEIVNSDYDSTIAPYTGDSTTMARGGIARYADGGVPIDPNAQAPIVPAQVNPNMQVGIVPTAAVGNKYTIQPTTPPQAVTDFNNILATRAKQEYVASPHLTASVSPAEKTANVEKATDQITGLYKDILGREPDQGGLDYWTKTLQGGTKITDIQNQMKSSNEYLVAHPDALKTQITNTYKDILGREPDQGGLDYWSQQIKQGQTLADLQNQFKSSPEYLAAHPTSQITGGGGFGGTGGIPTNLTPTGVTQADIDAYMAAHPTNTRTFNPTTKTYSTPTPTAAEVAAWKTSQITPTNTTYTAPDGSMWTSKEAYDNAHPVTPAAKGGLMAAYAGGGMPGYDLGGYSDGGRLLKGPGDGMSDNIPASIGQKQPARLADGEFVVPADVVSHLGNGSTDAGAKRLYSMMDKVRQARTGNKKQGKQIKADKYLPK